MSISSGTALLILVGCCIGHGDARKLPCSGFPCQNGGKCIQVPSGRYACYCPPYYTGRHCEKKKGHDFCYGKPDGNYKDPHDCYGFITCSNYMVYKRDCPDGLKYNQHKDQCDWPKNVKCGDPGYGKAGFCKHRADGDYKDPDNCFGFITCSNHLTYKRDCPAGLKYNKAMNWCDWPKNVLCNPDRISCRNKKDGIYKDPYNSFGYITCSHGLAYKVACPTGLKFSEKTGKCDQPHHDDSC